MVDITVSAGSQIQEAHEQNKVKEYCKTIAVPFSMTAFREGVTCDAMKSCMEDINTSLQETIYQIISSLEAEWKRRLPDLESTNLLVNDSEVARIAAEKNVALYKDQLEKAKNEIEEVRRSENSYKERILSVIAERDELREKVTVLASLIEKLQENLMREKNENAILMKQLDQQKAKDCISSDINDKFTSNTKADKIWHPSSLDVENDHGIVSCTNNIPFSFYCSSERGEAAESPSSGSLCGFQETCAVMDQLIPTSLLDSIISSPYLNMDDHDDDRRMLQTLDDVHGGATRDPTSVQPTLPEGMSCPVCMDRVADTRCLPCKHMICNVCIGKWKSRSIFKQAPAECPLCRGNVNNYISIGKSLSSTSDEMSVSAEICEYGNIESLSEVFDDMHHGDLEEILRMCNGDVEEAVDYIQKNGLNRRDMTRKGANIQSSNWKTEICMYYIQGKCNKSRRSCSYAHGEGDLIKSSRVLGYKFRLCKGYLDGSCTKSRRDCINAHGETDLRTNDANSGNKFSNLKTELCYYYMKGCCNYNKEECRFAHGEEDMRVLSPGEDNIELSSITFDSNALERSRKQLWNSSGISRKKNNWAPALCATNMSLA